jgi:hypothetical protein
MRAMGTMSWSVNFVYIASCDSSTYNPALGLGYNVNQFMLRGEFFNVFLYQVRYPTYQVHGLFLVGLHFHLYHKVVIYPCLNMT